MLESPRSGQRTSAHMSLSKTGRWNNDPAHLDTKSAEEAGSSGIEELTGNGVPSEMTCCSVCFAAGQTLVSHGSIGRVTMTMRFSRTKSGSMLTEAVLPRPPGQCTRRVNARVGSMHAITKIHDSPQHHSFINWTPFLKRLKMHVQRQQTERFATKKSLIRQGCRSRRCRGGT
jgi:hypothetical protein